VHKPAAAAVDRWDRQMLDRFIDPALHATVTAAPTTIGYTAAARYPITNAENIE